MRGFLVLMCLSKCENYSNMSGYLFLSGCFYFIFLCEIARLQVFRNLTLVLQQPFLRQQYVSVNNFHQQTSFLSFGSSLLRFERPAAASVKVSALVLATSVEQTTLQAYKLVFKGFLGFLSGFVSLWVLLPADWVTRKTDAGIY